jgi:hypothetical protein
MASQLAAVLLCVVGDVARSSAMVREESYRWLTVVYVCCVRGQVVVLVATNTTHLCNARQKGRRSSVCASVLVMRLEGAKPIGKWYYVRSSTGSV